MNFVQFVTLATLFYVAKRVVDYYRHPLRKFPGPFLASVSPWYRAYYDLWHHGGWLDQLRVLHEQYGPVVRASPEELHFASTDAYFDIYHTGSKWQKHYDLYRVSGRDDSSFVYANPSVAQKRRAVLAPMLSRKAVINLEDVIHEKIAKMLDKSFEYYERTGNPVNLYRGFRCVSQDIISQYAFGSCFNCLDSENFNHPMVESTKRSIRGVWYSRYFPKAQKVLQALGLRAVSGTKNMRDFISSRLDLVWDERGTPGFNELTHKTVYHHLLTPNPAKGHIPPSKKSCLDEGMTIVGAGGENTGSVTTAGTFFTYYQPELAKQVQAELRDIWPDLDGPAPKLEQLEKLPLLTGIIKEALRFAVGAAVPLARNVGPKEVTIGGFQVPPNTIVAQGQSFMHENPNIWKNPADFDPDRWCQPNSSELDHYLVSFSRGPRQCLGINLAWGELYIMFAHTFRKMEVEIVNTSPEDFKFRQFLIPYFSGREFHAKVKRVAS